MKLLEGIIESSVSAVDSRWSIVCSSWPLWPHAASCILSIDGLRLMTGGGRTVPSKANCNRIACTMDSSLSERRPHRPCGGGGCARCTVHTITQRSQLDATQYSLRRRTDDMQHCMLLLLLLLLLVLVILVCCLHHDHTHTETLIDLLILVSFPNRLTSIFLSYS